MGIFKDIIGITLLVISAVWFIIFLISLIGYIKVLIKPPTVEDFNQYDYLDSVKKYKKNMSFSRKVVIKEITDTYKLNVLIPLVTVAILGIVGSLLLIF